jgi:hypothetical protein
LKTLHFAKAVEGELRQANNTPVCEHTLGHVREKNCPYCTSIVVTLNAGRVTVMDDPLAGIDPAATGTMGFWLAADAAVIW